MSQQGLTNEGKHDHCAPEDKGHEDHVDELIDWVPVVPANNQLSSGALQHATTLHVLRIEGKVSLKRSVQAIFTCHCDWLVEAGWTKASEAASECRLAGWGDEPQCLRDTLVSRGIAMEVNK